LKKLNSLVSLIKEPIKEIQPAHSITIEVPAAATQKKVDDNVASEQKKLLDFNKLAKIRQEITERKNKVETKEVKILTKELLETLWQEAVTHVVINGEQQLTKTVLQSVALRLVTENEFEVTVQSNINEKMVEEVRKDITEYIKKATNNRDILFRLKVVHDDDAIRKLDEEYIPKKKQYENIAEKYPNVKLLKENLRLDIDY
jgi:DNA polymerase-3 subunit gamma/tau